MAMNLADTFAALADPTRVDIVTRLSHGAASVSELAEPFDMTLRGVLKHIQVLEHAGLVRSTKQGRTRHCELEPTWLSGAAAWVNRVESMWNRRVDRIAMSLEEDE
jgi:DNA-binding transcriptional ArsR family regulator